MSSRASSHIEKMCNYSNACYLFFLRKGSLAYQASTVDRRGLREHHIVRKSCKLSIYMIFFKRFTYFVWMSVCLLVRLFQ